VGRSWAVPGSKILRIERFGRELHQELADTVGPLMLALHRRFRFVLRLSIALFDEHADRRAHMRSQLEQVGFRSTSSRHYTETLRLPLDRDVDRVFSQLTYGARRGIRTGERAGIHIFRIDTPGFLARMQDLYVESFRRTGSLPAPVDLPAILESTRTSESSVLFGASLQGNTDPSHLAAYAWVRSHGDHATYDIGASGRIPSLGNAAVGYPVLWRCIEWAVQRGHSWFDLGGVIEESAPPDHPLAGISRFKQSFSKERLRVSEELVLEPNPTLAALAAKSEQLQSVFPGLSRQYRASTP
jgi:hypothetical protein